MKTVNLSNNEGVSKTVAIKVVGDAPNRMNVVQLHFLELFGFDAIDETDFMDLKSILEKHFQEKSLAEIDVPSDKQKYDAKIIELVHRNLEIRQQKQEYLANLKPEQLYFLELFSSSNLKQEDLSEIKKILNDYFGKLVEKELKEHWEKNNFTKASWEKATKDLHLRKRKPNK